MDSNTGDYGGSPEQSKQPNHCRARVAREKPLLVAALLGPLFYRRWFSRKAIDDQFVQATISRVIATTLARARRPAAR